MTGFGDTSTTKISMYMSKISGHAPPVPPAWGGGKISEKSLLEGRVILLGDGGGSRNFEVNIKTT